MVPFIVPVLGDGKYRFQPVALQNVSEGFVQALAHDGSVGKTYDVAGRTATRIMNCLIWLHTLRENIKLKFINRW